MSRFRLAIFDLDGTLVDTVGDITDALNFTMRAMGMPELPEARVAGMLGEGVTDLLDKVMGQGAADAAAFFRSCYVENLCDRSMPYPGIPELLEAARVEKAVAASKPGGMARRILAELGLTGHFVQVVGDDDVGRKKPDPLVIATLLHDRGMRAEEALLVGDGLEDARMARAAGIAFCAVTWGYAPRAALAGEHPDYLVDTMGELATLVG